MSTKSTPSTAPPSKRTKTKRGNWLTKCFHAAYYYLDDPPHHPNVPQVDWEVPIEVGGEIRAAVPVNEFAKHVASLHADGDIGFSREYEAIQNECVTDDMPCEHSQHPENKRKNRYLNITAYDHSRVHLHPTPGQKKNLDYINANFIDGYQKSRAFIGTQGPLPDTFDCFWRMIWEQRVAIIVMITNLVERGRRKCDMYWPKDGIETFGVIQVKLVEEEVMSTYTVRTLQIKHLKLKKKKQANIEKIVYQYHYTNWPDHGTPDHPLPVLNFVKKSSAANPADAGPIVVHCSAGVGRTGTYIVLDAMLKQIQQKGVVNVFGFLRHIRIQRNFLVQTEEQYIFIHDALVEAIASGETNLRAEQIEELKNCTPYLEQQYKNIIQFQTKDIHIASAMKQVNSIKNRGAIFPIEGSRVHLTPKPGEEGSDFINASWLHGFRRLRDFIVTQHPMAHTIKDFWQMVWDHNAQTIVLLSSLDEINFAQFWPDDGTPIESDYYRVKFLSKTNKNDYVSRDFVIQSIQDDYELSVKMLHCPSWPEMSNPNSIYDFIVDVHERCNDYRNGPIVVVDRYGGAQACTFCAISSLAIEMEYCNTANVYQYAKLYHNKRPGVWTSSEDIRLIYNIISFMPRNLQLLKRTALRTEFEDVTTATPDLYSKICSNGNVTQKQLLNNCNNQLLRNNSSSINNSIATNATTNTNYKQLMNQNQIINNAATTTITDTTTETAIATAAATITQNRNSTQSQKTPSPLPSPSPILIQSQSPTLSSTASTTTTTTSSTTPSVSQKSSLPSLIMNPNLSAETINNTTTSTTTTTTTSTTNNSNTHDMQNVLSNDSNYTNNTNFTTTNNAASPTNADLMENDDIMQHQQLQQQPQQHQPQQQQQLSSYLPTFVKNNGNAVDNDIINDYLAPPPPNFAYNHARTSPTASAIMRLVDHEPIDAIHIDECTALSTNEQQPQPPTTPTTPLGAVDGLMPLLASTNSIDSYANACSSGNAHTITPSLSHSSAHCTTANALDTNNPNNGLLNHHHHQHQNNHNNNNNNQQHHTSQRLTAVTDAQSLDIVG